MFELSITVGVMASFLGLAIDLAAVVEAFEQLGDTARRNLMPHAAHRCCEFRMALGYPHEQPHGVAECRRFKQPLKILQKRRIGLRERRASTARTSNLLLRKIKRYQVLQAAIDRAPRYSLGPRHGAHAAVPAVPASAAANKRRSRSSRPERIAFVTASNRSLINHPSVIDIRRMRGNPQTLKLGPQSHLDLIVSPNTKIEEEQVLLANTNPALAAGFFRGCLAARVGGLRRDRQA